MTLIKAQQNRIKVNSVNLNNSIKVNIEKKKKAYLKNISTLEAVSPLSVLSRGYSIITDEEKNIITSSEQLKVKQKIKARLEEGQVLAEVIEKIDE